MEWNMRASVARGAPAWRRICAICAFGLCFGDHARAAELTNIGLIVGDIGNPFFEYLARNVERATRTQLGDAARVTLRSSGYDLDRQIAQVRQMVADGVQLLIVNAVDTEGIGPTIDYARAAGVIVVAIDVRAKGAQAAVASDNFGAGQIACSYLAERLGGAGNLLIMNGPPTSSVVQRVKGCHAALAAHPQITVLADEEDCGGSVEGGLAYMTSMLNMVPRIDAVFAINDPTAIGADLAGAHAGRDDYFIVAIDGSPAAVEVIRQGDTRLVATVSQSPMDMADQSVGFGARLFAGEELEANESMTEISLVTRENIADYPGWSN